jgi:hypothetical protein
MAKIVPSERLRRELDEVLAGVAGYDDRVEAVARIGAWLIMQQALEDEVTEFLGRKRYQRADADDAAIYRNGYEPRTVKRRAARCSLSVHGSARRRSWGLRATCSARASPARTRWRR